MSAQSAQSAQEVISRPTQCWNKGTLFYGFGSFGQINKNNTEKQDGSLAIITESLALKFCSGCCLNALFETSVLNGLYR